MEVCPLSSRLLGHVRDLRNHPVRFMLNRGLQVSISSGYPGLFGFEDTALDYLTVYLAWDLTLRDLKKMSLNGIKHSSCDEATRSMIENEVFPKKWARFLEQVIEKHDIDYLHY